MTFTFSTDEAAKATIIHLLKHYYCGQEKAIKKRDLLRLVYGEEAAANESYNNLLDRKLRAAIEEINAEGGVICSSSAGYWWAASLSDGLVAAERNKARALTQLHNAENLVDNLKATYGGQMELL